MFKYGVLSGPHFLVFGLNTEIYRVNLHFQSRYRKIRSRKNSIFRHFPRSVNASKISDLSTQSNTPFYVWSFQFFMRKNLKEMFRRFPFSWSYGFNQLKYWGRFIDFLPTVKYRSSPPKVFIGKGVVGKVQGNFIEITLRPGCSSVNLLHIFKAPFPKHTSEGLLLKVPYIYDNFLYCFCLENTLLVINEIIAESDQQKFLSRSFKHILKS